VYSLKTPQTIKTFEKYLTRTFLSKLVSNEKYMKLRRGLDLEILIVISDELVGRPAEPCQQEGGDLWIGAESKILK